jgi:pilus assembly protein Flp/PilA
MRTLANLIADESGQDLIEYAMMAALIGLGSIATLRGLASEISNTFVAVGNALHSKCPPGVSCITGR